METHFEYRRKAQIALIAITVLTSLAVVALLVALIYYCYRRSKVYKGHENQSYAGHNVKSDFANLQVVADNGLQVFACKQLHSATNGFSKSNVIGHGRFGLVYRGVLNNGRNVAIKFMDEERKQGEEEFKIEVELLGQLHCSYLVKLLGYCSGSDHKFLAYEFMANGSLQDHLYPVRNSYVTPMELDWNTRLRIALEAAKGLEYLHEHVSPPVIHRDFKSSNILLDKQFHAKVSDFGLAKLGSDKAGGHVSTRVLGTHGYVAPEYALTGHLTTKSDVYSYGVVLLELLTGRVPVDMERPPGEGVLVSWAMPLLNNRRNVAKIADPALEGQYSMKELTQVAAIAALCVQPEVDYRPLMADVVQSLAPLVKTHRETASKLGNHPSFHVNKLSKPQDSVKATM